MPSFTGKFQHSIDAKGRLIVPARLRPALGGGEVVLSWWFEGCVALWSAEDWEEIESRLRAQRSSNPGTRAVVRKLSSSAHRDEIDKQGRIPVPQHLRDHAGLEKDVVVIGALNHAELWSPERLRGVEEQGEERLVELAAELDF